MKERTGTLSRIHSVAGELSPADLGQAVHVVPQNSLGGEFCGATYLTATLPVSLETGEVAVCFGKEGRATGRYALPQKKNRASARECAGSFVTCSPASHVSLAVEPLPGFRAS